MMVNDSIEQYYRMNLKLITDFNFKLNELDEMFPFERELYVSLIIQDIEAKKQKHLEI